MTVPAPRHGGALAEAERRFGHPRAAWLDLSTGINPNPWPADHLAIGQHRLPDPEDLQALETAAARHFGCAPDRLCALPGSEAGLRLVGEILEGPAFHRSPGYGTHGEMLAGIRPLATNDLDQADDATLLLANPGNPDGRLFPRETLLALLARRGSHGWLLVDEAFADCHPEASLAPFVADDRRLLSFRSFGKFFGLAGVRLGFVLGPAPFIARLRARLGSWPLSAAAIAIGHAAYRDQAWIAATRKRLAEQAARLDALLANAGLAAAGASPLFRLVRCPDAGRLFAHLAQRAILTRPFADDGAHLRFGLPADAAAMARLAAALAEHG